MFDIGIDRSWENWKEDGVTQAIHEYWIHSDYEMSHRRALARLVHSLHQVGECFLEVGCGSGLVYKELVPNVISNAHYSGCDITEDMLSIARRDFPEGIFLHDDAYHLSFADGSFEIVAAFEVLGHLGNIEIPIKEMVRVASRLVVFTVWTGPTTQVGEERFKNTVFFHTEFSHADLLKAINNATNREYTLQTVSLDKYTTAYIISFISNSAGETDVTALSP